MKRITISAACALLSTTAGAAVISEPTYYSYWYIAPTPNVFVLWDNTIEIRPESTQWRAAGDHGIWFSNKKRKNLKGATYVLNGASSPVFDGLIPDGTNEQQGSWMFPYVGTPYDGSWTKFGSTNNIIEWGITGYVEHYHNDAFFAQKSEATLIVEDMPWLSNRLIDWELLKGIRYYDVEEYGKGFEWEDTTIAFATQPGYWLQGDYWDIFNSDGSVKNPPKPKSHGRLDAQVATAPIPASVLMLLSAIAGLFVVNMRRLS